MLLDINDPVLTERFDSFIATSPYGNLLQTRAWAQVKAGWDSHYFYHETDGEIDATLSVLSVMDSRFGGRLYYAPRGPVCDLNRIDAVTQLITEAEEYAREHEGFLLRVDPGVPDDEALRETYATAGFPIARDPGNTTQPLMSLVLEINGRTPEQLLADLSKNTRKNVRKSYRLGVTNRVGGREDLPEFYRLFEMMNKHHGISYRPYEYFERLYDAFEDHVRLSFSMYEGRAITTSFLVTFGRTANALYGADSHEFQIGQSYQINYEEISYAAEQGCDFYDMGGIFHTDEENGLYHFKRKFTEDNVINWIGNIDRVVDQEKYDKFHELTGRKEN
ncbi:lipid II:glycine glycyltransferase FemX [Arcanobacterium haemolyticum]|uniref:Methicillin resistance protein n=1 Tax=Arcanobacterium haemolyticum (strain ATCC 9345 / DSM 20595 / CCM 5947 / CCUG 17215 / LMG 16163 / NBRC 15585 / NCTC 8452 / 11018) TaxID=644284 RepID=D7BLX8_ARCHD|nr:peptidoglycan bridge formation glycyltransferase FemA/FemB family protein [Arcanobacterium haemolyticum]ADH91927.1 Methicillin resistance protein [Arcanobacterium haemolyticum DSM 20595]SQH26954.1 Lipid II:glycine glycyltransferase [Arcanobacterium haemolyticum]